MNELHRAMRGKEGHQQSATLQRMAGKEAEAAAGSLRRAKGFCFLPAQARAAGWRPGAVC